MMKKLIASQGTDREIACICPPLVDICVCRCRNSTNIMCTLSIGNVVMVTGI